ncbi:hypothetical protein [uncultured Mucilaginibacter sp.]|uniref:hypothetical protein n=1 Tax=uncultured Mucilaginibacter sp. TaxID=797541 RepID=UPI0025D76E52|nr:hypothetical protein [uncultured Mucilaginibacter sp.]
MPIFHKLYFPGLISLLFLPLMCIGYFAFTGKFQQLTLLPVAWFNKDGMDQFNKFRKEKFDVFTFRKYTDLVLIGDTRTDDVSLNQMKYSTTNLLKTNDFATGVCVAFSNNARYDEMVAVIDFCNQSKGVDFILYDNKVFIYKLKPVKYKSPSYVGLLDNDIVIYKPKLSFADKFKLEINSFLKELLPFWPSALVLFLMAWLTFSSKARYLNPKNFNLTGD